jgi:hypothetical protein
MTICCPRQLMTGIANLEVMSGMRDLMMMMMVVVVVVA